MGKDEENKREKLIDQLFPKMTERQLQRLDPVRLNGVEGDIHLNQTQRNKSLLVPVVVG